MGTLLFLIAIAGLIFLMIRFGLGRRRGHLDSAPSSDTAFDPACRMSVGTSWAKSTGRTYYFCTANNGALPWLNRCKMIPATGKHR